MSTEVSTIKEINLDYLKLEVDPHQSLIRLFWKRQVTISELRTGFYTAAEVAATYGCKYWLGDARNTTMLDIEAQEYVVKDLVNLISQAGIRKIARLVNEQEMRNNQSFSMKLKIETRHAENIRFETALFADEAQALNWLFE